MLLKSIFALQCLAISLTAAFPIEHKDTSTGYKTEPRAPAPYTQNGGLCYKGRQFPSTEEWLSFDQLWAINKPQMLAADSPSEVDAIHKYIQEAANAAGIKREIFLAIMMQESGGNVRTKSGDGVTPGLMQALGSPDCLKSGFGQCPHSTIRAMLFAGALGTHLTQGLASCFNMYGQQYGPMLRCYNSGSILDPLNLDLVKFGTPSYVSDVANRLRGVEPRKDCGFGVGIPSPGH
ncbi:hypothetical protein EMCG_03372 [[Emmonsia] crescens]|uniref:Transglycosylase SLT domain-containing protein n=1 Tax=[Emmonsia] crescens TaxID=73230 RepID=A0A0G2HVN7_9EURO|nr:hypothetical protein EMCG_03372 [Emmonsia crescens UAMH 3008]